MPNMKHARLSGLLLPAADGFCQAKSWKGLDTRIIYKAEVNQKGDNPPYIVTSIKDATAETIYEDLYCPRGQDENFIKHLKSDLSGDRLSDQGFLANHLRMLYACAAYVLHYELRTKALQGTELEKAQPSTVIMKFCKIAVKVVEYKDRIKLHLPRQEAFAACDRGLLPDADTSAGVIRFIESNQVK